MDHRAKTCRGCSEPVRVTGPQPGRRGEGNPSWRGGRREHKSTGYVSVYAPDHPRAGTARAVGEHTLVMEKLLGRYLLPGETAHHKNGVRNDNRPENLELWVKSQPAGQRATDLVAWAREIIERYGDLA